MSDTYTFISISAQMPGPPEDANEQVAEALKTLKQYLVKNGFKAVRAVSAPAGGSTAAA